MKFSIYENAFKGPRECTKDLFWQTIRSNGLQTQVAKIRAAESKDERDNLKKELPAVSWSALCEGKRGESYAVPSGLYMLDIDDISDMQTFRENLDRAIAEKGGKDNLGIAAMFYTPSGNGFKIVAKFVVDDLKTIAGHQAWLANELGLDDYDEATKDVSRLSFLVPFGEFVYINDKILFDDSPVINIVNQNYGETQRMEAVKEGLGQHRTFTDSQKNFTYKDVLISDIAKMWVEQRGIPEPGERHTYYYRLCHFFRYICDSDYGVLLAQLPDFGLSMAEREKECSHACARAVGAKIPLEFYKFLGDMGIIETSYIKAAEEEDEEQTIFHNSIANTLPDLPPIFKDFCMNSPEDFRMPQIYAMMPMLGLLAHVKGNYFGTDEIHTPTFHNVIFAPPSSGKSFVRYTANRLLERLMAHDEESAAVERLYKKEKRSKKNMAVKVPENPKCPMRIIAPLISVPKILERQEAAQGMSTISIIEEIDTLKKTNTMQNKSDVYRNSWDNADYSQDYMSDETWCGKVKLFYSILTTGTPEQLMRFYYDPEDGLISRCSFIEIQNQCFAERPRFKPFTKAQQCRLEKVLDFAEALTYKRNEDGEFMRNKQQLLIPNERRDITEDIKFILPTIEKWMEKYRLIAKQNVNYALDMFRKRCGCKGYRLAMLCWLCYRGEIDKNARKVIRNFVVWFMEKDLETLMNLYEEKYKYVTLSTSVKNYTTNVFDCLQDTFSKEDVEKFIKEFKLSSRARQLIYEWKKSGLIEKDGRKYVKLKN